MNAQKQNEYWLELYWNEDKTELLGSSVEINPPFIDAGYVHVIEKSHFDRLVNDYRKLEIATQKWKEQASRLLKQLTDTHYCHYLERGIHCDTCDEIESFNQFKKSVE